MVNPRCRIKGSTEEASELCPDGVFTALHLYCKAGEQSVGQYAMWTGFRKYDASTYSDLAGEQFVKKSCTVAPPLNQMWGSGVIYDFRLKVSHSAQPNGDKLFLEPRKDPVLYLRNRPQRQGLHPIFTNYPMSAKVVCDVWDRSYASGNCDDDNTFSLV